MIDPGNIWKLVIADLQYRYTAGIRLKTLIQNYNDPIIAAYQEALDQCVHLRQFIKNQNILVKKETPEDDTPIPTLFTDTGPMLKAMESMSRELKSLQQALRDERQLRRQSQHIARKVIAMINRNTPPSIQTMTTPSNAAEHIEKFEDYVYQIILGCNPKTT